MAEFPKIIHQTWKTRDLSSIEEFRLCSESWRRHHRDHTYRLWDDGDNAAFVREQFPDYFDTWVSFDKNIKRLDSIRYMWMYVYGGIYADLDMECLQSLDALIETHREHDILLFCDLESALSCISANPALIISKPGSPFWLEVLEYARLHRDEYVTRCTGPDALGRVANLHREKFAIHYLDQNRLFIRKSKHGLYTRIPGNELDHRIYKKVFCSTAKPKKYFEDKKRKLVADWHGTPKHLKWHREYDENESAR